MSVDGAQAEARALRHLESQGLRLLERNWRCRGGELDLVMQDGDTIAIVEVRARGRADFGGALESVTARKQARIVRATRLLLSQRPQWAERDIRFDVVAIEGDEALEWLRGAFEAADG